MKHLDLIWVMFRIYMNNPSYIIKQSDVLKDLFGRKEDIDHFMNTLGVRKYKRDITFGELLTKLEII